MTNLSSIFDGVIDNEITIKPPIAVLKELANEFEKLTKGLLIAEVKQKLYRGNKINLVDGFFFPYDTFVVNFSINAPSLNNYTYWVFRISYGLDFYPVELNFNKFSGQEEEEEEGVKNASNQEELNVFLKEVFSSSEVKKVINGLLAQIKSS